MGRVRASLITNGVLFVQQTYGAAAHEKILSALPDDARGTLTRTLRETAWESFDHMITYMEAAKAQLAPDDDEFYLKMGRFSGRRSRLTDGFEPMVSQRRVTIRMATLLWHAMHDTGRAEIFSENGCTATVRIYDFPTRRAHCARVRGAMEGLLSGPIETVQACEMRCRADGAPYCEMRIIWTPTGA